MAGIYLHIPYCRQACRYCDFHFTVSVWQKKDLLPFMYREIKERSEYLGGEKVESIYFGGGTPSVLEIGEVVAFLELIYRNHKVSEDVEISFEANPEDLKPSYLKELKSSGVNRLSIGIQSFNDHDLELMHRIHNSEQAIKSVKDSQEAGFGNISIDLMYGLPRQDPGVWEKNLEKALSMDTQHISAYHLSYEEGTIFDHWRKKGRIQPVPEEDSLTQFRTLIRRVTGHGYEHYEISNFAREGYYSRHNSSYWQQKKYLGIGPGAHSYDGSSRRWNVRNNKKYCEEMQENRAYYDTEELSEKDRYNEFIMTSLRTLKGINISLLSHQFGTEKTDYFTQRAVKYSASGHLLHEGDIFRLIGEGIFISDHIIADLFLE
ncbi:MAG: radical SAM family heme chaperone HemW [Bacteroidales bacterium]|nr:radical SAM family heme chaperone HemW [Bacteroidales bacterium]MCB8999781.1 radical SAM family heme chaperone HemW [Bacteroidales bacterium]